MTVTRSTLDGFFKTRYGDKIQKLQPSFNVLSRKIPFASAKKLGKDFRFPVRLRRSMGVTYNGGNDYGTAFTLNSAVSGLTAEASVSGTELVLRESVAYGVVSQAKSSVEAFGSAFDEIVADMTTSAAFHREMAILYGGTSIGAVSGTPNQPTATTAEVIISAASWAPGLWVQMEGGYVDVYDATGATLRNDSTATAAFEVTLVDADTRTVTLTGEATDIDAIANTDIIRPRGSTSNIFTGIDGILTNTGSLFGIDASTYNLWLANTYSASSAALTMAKLTAAHAKAVVRGGMRDVIALVSTYTWTDLNNSHTDLRRFNSSTKNGGVDLGTVGTEGAIKYHGPGGTISVVPHPMVKAGECFVIDPACFRRIGSTDTTFDLGIEGQQNRFFRELADSAGFELRCYWDQALICMRPNAQVKITGIVNTAG